MQVTKMLKNIGMDSIKKQIFEKISIGHRTIFDDFTFTADLEFIFHTKKSAEIFHCPLFCC